MSGRIRTIKPDFFLHEGLFDLEKETGFPIRVVFPGLWCHADREGRFEWKPRRLKAKILPYDSIEFEEILNSLKDAGFIKKYHVKEKTFGEITNWEKHQRPNAREKQSTIPSHASTCKHVQEKAEGEWEGEGELDAEESRQQKTLRQTIEKRKPDILKVLPLQEKVFETQKELCIAYYRDRAIGADPYFVALKWFQRVTPDKAKPNDSYPEFKGH